MRAQNHYVQFAVPAVLTLSVLCTVTFCLPTPGFGQETGNSKPTSAPDSSTRPIPPTEKKRAPQDGNPLQIRSESTATDAATQSTLSHEFNDYRHIGSTPKKTTGPSLPLFGYDIFKQARDLNDSYRAMIAKQSLLELDNPQPGKIRSSNREATTTDLGPVMNGTRNSRRPTTRRSTGSDSDMPGARNGDADTASGQGDDNDSNSNGGQNSQRTTRRRAQDSGSNQDNGSDNSSDNQSSRSRDNFDPDFQSAYTEPIGPLAQLYRGISASVPDNYTLGNGDRLRIRIESPTFESKTSNVVVDPRGQIKLEPVGNIVVRGMTLSSAEKAIEIRLKSYIKDARVSIETGLLRTMSILVTGAAYVPGTYLVPATATAFNVLYIAGGPTDDGSLRDIEVMRQGKKIATLDIYKMVTGNPGWTDVPLSAGDTIIVKNRVSRVTVSGEVLRPAVFELSPNETLKDALNYAGGVKATGLNQSVRLNTVKPGAERIIVDLNVASGKFDQQTLFDGDTVEVFSVRNRLNNRVTIEGAVDQPNDYQLQEGMRVSDLVQQARGPLSEAYLQRAELHRWQKDNTDLLIPIDLEKALANDPNFNLPLQKWDRLKVYTRDDVAWTGRRTVVVDGAVKRPGVYEYSKNMHVDDLLRAAGGPTPDADLENAHLFHHHDDGPDNHEFVNIAAAIKRDPNKNPEVMDSDRLILLTVQQSTFTPDHQVSIKGEVVNPGKYPRFKGMKVSDLLAFAGGFRPSANNQVVLAHARRVADSSTTKVVSINFDTSGRCAAAEDVPLEDGDVISVQGVGGFQPEVQSITVSGSVNKPGVIFLTKKDMRLSDAIREAGGLRPEAFADGAEFYRNPQMLASTGQRSLVATVSKLNDLLNDSETKRELAKAQIDLVKATGNAVADSAGLAGIGALTGGAAAAAIPNPAANAVAGNLANTNLVSPARVLDSGQLDPNGYVAVDLRAALARPKGADDIVLVNGDTIDVPETLTTVSVIGAVNSPRGVLYDSGKKLNYYLDLAGGFNVDAAKDRILIFHRGGGVIPGQRAKDLKPGDIVFVPTKVLAAKIAGKSNGLDSFFKSITSSALIFKLFGLF